MYIKKKRFIPILLLCIIISLLLIGTFNPFNIMRNNTNEYFETPFIQGYYEPIYIKEFNIFDVYYNDNGQLILIVPYLENVPQIKYMDKKENKFIEFNVNICPHKHTYIYYATTDYNDNIRLKINDSEISTTVNKFPEFHNEIIFSTLVKNEDNYIIQWIEFHKKLGVTRFIIYDNSNDNTLSKVLSQYITNKEVVLIRWNYLYLDQHAQPTHQNHSLYAFQNCRFIGFFDVDEYINIQKKTNLPDFFDNFINENNIDTSKISSFRLLSKIFNNPDNQNTDGYNFLKIFTCSDIVRGEREKNFVIPKNVKTFSVHMVTDGLPMYDMNEKYIYFNHYMFLNKPERNMNNNLLKDDSILMHIDI